MPAVVGASWPARRGGGGLERAGPVGSIPTHRLVMETAVDAGLILRTPCRVEGAATERLPETRAATPEQGCRGHVQR